MATRHGEWSEFETRRCLATSTPGSGLASDVLDQVVKVNCRGRTCQDLIPDLKARIREAASPSSIVLLLEHVDRLDDSIVEFLTELHRASELSASPLVLLDPSGSAAWVMKSLPAAPRLRVFSQDPGTFVPLRILIVEENEGAMDVLQVVLSSIGHDCQIARTAGEARRNLVVSRTDVVLLDMGRRSARALSVAAFLKQHQASIALLGLTEEDFWNPEITQRYGFRRMIAKPYSLLELLEAIRDNSNAALV